MNKLEITYYPSPVVSSWETLTFLGLVFDKVHFPGVYLPTEGFTKKELGSEIKRLQNLDNPDIDTNILINVLIFCYHQEFLRDFCLFTESPKEVFEAIDDEVGGIANIIEEMIHGPRRKGFVPIFSKHHGKSISEEAGINYPGWLTYPANALIYSGKHDIPLLNDNSFMPIPSIGGLSAKDNAKLLSLILSIECVKFALPVIPSLIPEQICELRESLKDSITPFRIAVLKLSKELNSMIRSDSNEKEIQKAAKFLIETEVLPKIEELNSTIEKPKLPWLKKAFEVSKIAPELLTNFFTLPANIAITKVLGAIGSILVEFDSKDKERKDIIRQNGFYYILKLKKII